jgi:hypothetical protein
MNALKKSLIAIACSLLVSTLAAQTQSVHASVKTVPTASDWQSQLHVPARYAHSNPVLRFLASDEGRLFLKLEGHPLAEVMEERFGPAPEGTKLPVVLRDLLEAQKSGQISAAASSAPKTASTATVPCSGPTGTRFNLEPRPVAVNQAPISVDFILNGAGPNNDLIMETGVDSRALNMSGWDFGLSGYYVHDSTTADCSVQFEGGLPPLVSQGLTFLGLGAGMVADNTRNAFFAFDSREGVNTQAVGLFRISQAQLMNKTACPNGTHTLAQATSCWEQTPPVIVPATELAVTDTSPVLGGINLAVDQRPTGSAVGAGDLYVIYDTTEGLNSQETQISPTMNIVACDNATLSCGTTPFTVQNASFNSIHVAENGIVTVLGNLNGVQSFWTCTPAGAPKAPVCGTPSTFPAASGLIFGFDHVVRPGPGNNFTAFVLTLECTNLVTVGTTNTCLTAGQTLTVSTDSGKTWSTPVRVDTNLGTIFSTTMAVDNSTGTVSIAYESTEGDPTFTLGRVFVNQIAPASTTPGPPKMITTVFDDPNGGILGFGGSGIGGIAARGTGITGHSRLYVSFSSSAVDGIYGAIDSVPGAPLPDLNNNISLLNF